MKTFGSDPELMVGAGETRRSAIGVVQGNIENRILLLGHEFYYDNVLAECAVKYGASKEEVLRNFKECFQLYSQMVHPLKLYAQASHTFSDEDLAHPDARRVGCAKDRCAYELREMEPPTASIERSNFRSAGGHIHLGADVLMQDGPEQILVVYMLDLFCAVPSLWLDHDPTSPMRRQLYGQAGRYRVKDYGLEYRSLGNFWINSPSLVELFYDLSMFVLEFVETSSAWELWDFDLEKLFDPDQLTKAWTCKKYDPKLLCQSVNRGDKKTAEPFYELALGLLPRDLRGRVESLAARTTDGDLHSNWQLR